MKSLGQLWMDMDEDSTSAMLRALEKASKNAKPPAPPKKMTVHIHGTSKFSAAVLSRALQRVNFSVIEKRTEDTATTAVPAIAAKMARAVKRALGDDAAIAALIDDDPADIAAFELNAADVGKIKAEFGNALKQGWNIGQSMAQNELDRAGAERPEQQAVAMAALRDKAAAFFDANAFRMAGNLRDGARSIIQQNLQQAVKSGWTVEQTRANIWDSLTSKGFTDRGSVKAVESDEKVNALLDALWVDSEEGATAYLNTLVRTNVFEAMNEARYNEFTDPALADFVQALEYSAILDERTCFAAGTAVYLASGKARAIEECIPGDEVISGSGTPRKVLARKTAITTKWREIRFDDGSVVRATPTHPFWSIQSGNPRWVEAKALACGDKIGARILPQLRETISSVQEIASANTLQLDMLASDPGEKLAHSEVPSMYQGVQGKENLRRQADEELGLVLFDGVQQDWPQGRPAARSNELQMRGVPQAVYCQAVGAEKRDASSALLEEMPKAARHTEMSALQEAVRVQGDESAAVLFGGLLPEFARRDEAGSDGTRGTDGTRNPIYSGGASRQALGGLSGSEPVSHRGGRRVLAFKRASESRGCEEGQGDYRCGLSSYEIAYPSCDGNRAVQPVAHACHEVVPIAELYRSIIAIRDIHDEPAFCYDLEIAEDHSYLVCSGLIAHNTEVCAAMDGRTYASDSEMWDTWRPPLHFNCRSVLIPVTVIDGWDGTESDPPPADIVPQEGFG